MVRQKKREKTTINNCQNEHQLSIIKRKNNQLVLEQLSGNTCVFADTNKLIYVSSKAIQNER